MMINSISSPEILDKISSIFMKWGAIVKDNPGLTFTNFIGSFVTEINKEFGHNVVFARNSRAVRGDGKNPANMAAVPKRTWGGSRNPLSK